MSVSSILIEVEGRNGEDATTFLRKYAKIVVYNCEDNIVRSRVEIRPRYSDVHINFRRPSDIDKIEITLRRSFDKDINFKAFLIDERGTAIAEFENDIEAGSTRESYDVPGCE